MPGVVRFFRIFDELFEERRAELRVDEFGPDLHGDIVEIAVAFVEIAVEVLAVEDLLRVALGGE